MIIIFLFVFVYLIALAFFINSYYKKYKNTENEARMANEPKEKEVLLKLAKKQRLIFNLIISYLIISLIGVCILVIFID